MALNSPLSLPTYALYAEEERVTQGTNGGPNHIIGFHFSPMPSRLGGRQGGRKLSQNECNNASKLNSKFDSDYKDCMDLLEREKQRETSAEDQMPIGDVPSVITAPKDAATQKKMLLRTKSTCSNATTTTQKMCIASRENGIVAASYRQGEPPRSRTKSERFDESSTLPTYMSLGASDTRRNDVRDNNMFVVSRERTEYSSSLKRIPLEGKLKMNGARNTDQDGEIERRLHYKEKLRQLAGTLTTSAAAERSREMISNIVERGKAAAAVQEEEGTEDDDDCVVTKEEQRGPPPKGKQILDGIRKRVYACSMRMCIDDAIIDHEGLVIAIPERTPFDCRCAEEDVHSTQSSEYYDDASTEFSSLTGATHHRFQPRYWYSNI